MFKFMGWTFSPFIKSLFFFSNSGSFILNFEHTFFFALINHDESMDFGVFGREAERKK